MTAKNIDVEELIYILSKLRSQGIKLMDLDMVKDTRFENMNKLILHPQLSEGEEPIDNQLTSKVSISNPNISTENNDIFDQLQDSL